MGTEENIVNEFLSEPKYHEYRNPRFESFIKTMSIVMTCLLVGAASTGLLRVFGSLWTFLFLFVYYLSNIMRDNTIYFYDDKDLGPGWKEACMEDHAHALRKTIVAMAIGWMIDYLLVLAHILE